MARGIRIQSPMKVFLNAGLFVCVGVLLACAVFASPGKAQPAEGTAESMVNLKGETVWYLDIALRARASDGKLTGNERNLRNFDVRVADLGDEIQVLFAARSKTGEGARLGGETSLGRDTAYEIRKSDGKILAAHGFK